ncbi:riboflavin synthase [Tindallia californiensis]|uniref:Riboflavin synthase n=1 Tax=Tindallia californiensis TaxID=159292 RepID=A0A1H3IRP9_9FIRM|nr:riboflavin synthase [Tindallia californiensis]SDY30400.1 riboflavin synthase alpha chain [Tindallia californiensis]
MFTGIVEEIGEVVNLVSQQNRISLQIKCQKVLQDVQLGDSIAVNGVCLTVTNFTAGQMEADVMPETIRSTSLSEAKPGKKVNLERALPVNGRLGGHIVTGHIDGIGTMIKKYQEKNAIWIYIKTTTEIMRYIVHKGSIAMDGTSLTVAKVEKDAFAVSIIPHTAEMTILTEKDIGAVINLECDIIGKYVEKLMMGKESENTGITVEKLQRYGF